MGSFGKWLGTSGNEKFMKGAKCQESKASLEDDEEI